MNNLKGSEAQISHCFLKKLRRKGKFSVTGACDKYLLQKSLLFLVFIFLDLVLSHPKKLQVVKSACPKFTIGGAHS